MARTTASRTALAERTTSCAEAGVWRIDASASTLQIGVKVGFIATVTGRFTDVTGDLVIGEELLDSRIAVEVRTASLTSGSSHWDSVLMAAGLVDTAANPVISFESTAVAPDGDAWRLSGLLVTSRGCLPVDFALSCVGTPGAQNRMRFRATGAIATKDAVRLLSQPGVERLVGKSMTVDLTIEAVRD